MDVCKLIGQLINNPMDKTTKEEKIYNLVIELEIAKRNKKDVVKAHSEEVKRIQAEIKELLTENE
jgi:hypothetical protein